MLLTSDWCTNVSWVNASLRFLDFLVKIWLLKACFLLILPVPVSLKRFLALDFVFCLGIFLIILIISLLHSNFLFGHPRAQFKGYLMLIKPLLGTWYSILCNAELVSAFVFYFFALGARNMVIRFPSNLGICSTFPKSSNSEASFSKSISPWSL